MLADASLVCVCSVCVCVCVCVVLILVGFIFSQCVILVSLFWLFTFAGLRCCRKNKKKN